MRVDADWTAVEMAFAHFGSNPVTSGPDIPLNQRELPSFPEAEKLAGWEATVTHRHSCKNGTHFRWHGRKPLS